VKREISSHCPQPDRLVTSFGAYVVAANLPSYSRETGQLDRHRFPDRSYDLAKSSSSLSGPAFQEDRGVAVFASGLPFSFFAQGSTLPFLPNGSSWFVCSRSRGRFLFAHVHDSPHPLLHGAEGTVLGSTGRLQERRVCPAAPPSRLFVYYHGFQSIFRPMLRHWAAGHPPHLRDPSPSAPGRGLGRYHKEQEEPGPEGSPESLQKSADPAHFPDHVLHMIFMPLSSVSCLFSCRAKGWILCKPIRACPQRSGLPGGAALLQEGFPTAWEEKVITLGLALCTL